MDIYYGKFNVTRGCRRWAALNALKEAELNPRNLDDFDVTILPSRVFVVMSAHPDNLRFDVYETPSKKPRYNIECHDEHGALIANINGLKKKKVFSWIEKTAQNI
jgi:hypothetical protein